MFCVYARTNGKRFLGRHHRFVGSVTRWLCTVVVREYVAHYNRERVPHHGLNGRLVTPANENGVEQIECRERLGGLLRYYHR